MAHIYVVDSATSLALRQGQLIIKNPELAHNREIPLASIEGISVFGMAQLSTQLIRTCLTEHIAIGYYTDEGHYIGKISSFDSLDPLRQKRQVELIDNTSFCLEWSKLVIGAKIKNCLKLLSPACNNCNDSERLSCPLWRALQNIPLADSIEVCLGYEGDAARRYFHCLNNMIVCESFKFPRRSTRPPKDPFNAMISYGYSLLYRNVVGAIERHGLHPYFGYMHKLRYGHAALASDLVEDCRAPLVDKTMLDLVNSGAIKPDGFFRREDGAVYMEKATMKLVTNELSSALVRKRACFASSNDARRYGFQSMLDVKLISVLAAIEEESAALYKPFVWR